MRAVLTRVLSASVKIDGEVVGSIGKGFLILLGVGPEDNAEVCKALAEKALSLRVFEDEAGKMNLGLDAVGGQVLVVSQFTLYGNCRRGRRPSFAEAAGPELGNELYEQFLAECTRLGYPPQHGRFGADMKVALGVGAVQTVNVRFLRALDLADIEAEVSQKALFLCNCHVHLLLRQYIQKVN